MDNREGFILRSKVDAKFTIESYEGKVLEETKLYTGPSFAHAASRMVDKDQDVTILENREGWALIKFTKGNNEYTGWVSSATVPEVPTT